MTRLRQVRTERLGDGKRDETEKCDEHCDGRHRVPLQPPSGSRYREKLSRKPKLPKPKVSFGPENRNQNFILLFDVVKHLIPFGTLLDL